MSDLKKIYVLDHGYVILRDHMGTDQRVADAARCLDEPEVRDETDTRLIRYMLKHGHTSPFEHVTFTFQVKAPIFVYRQWHRHRTWSYNEESARYHELKDEFYIPAVEQVRLQSKTNRQGSELSMSTEEALNYRNGLVAYCRHAYASYQNSLSQGMAREIARLVLPVNIYSTMYATVNLHNLMKFLHLRMDKHAQWEIRQYAFALYQLATYVAPISLQAWREDETGLEG